MQHLAGFGQRVLFARKRSHEPSTPDRAAILKPPQSERYLVPREMRRFDPQHLAREDSVTLEQLEREVARFISTNSGSFGREYQRPASCEARLQPRTNRGVVATRRTARDRLERSLGGAIVGEHPQWREVVVADASRRRHPPQSRQRVAL